MSWAGLASNQCVSCNNLQDAVNNGVFVLKNTIPSSNKEITTSEAEYYVYINTISKASNQLVVKSDLVSSGGWYTFFLMTGTTYYYEHCGSYTTGPWPITVYTNNPDAYSGATFYTNNALTNEFDGFELWYFPNPGNSVALQIGAVGEIINVAGC